MNVKVIVKVMNFHSLLRVDASRKRADKYVRMEQEVAGLIDLIMHNRSFLLDKKLFKVNPDAPALNIYLGSDYGFCGSINTQVKSLLQADLDGDKVVVGKKLPAGLPGELLRIPREEFDKAYGQIEKLLIDSLVNQTHFEINLIYNHYYNVGDIQITKKKVFPLELPEGSTPYTEDWVAEGDINHLLINLMLSYINYEIKVASVNSFAAENIIRQNATSESLKKIDEQEEFRLMEERKYKSQEAFRKVIDSYSKKRGFGGNEP